MSDTQIVTNNVPRDVLYFHELMPKQQTQVKSDYGWIDELESAEFFVYKGDVYAIDDFMAVHNHFYNPYPPDWMLPYDGYKTDTFFSCMLIKYPLTEWAKDYDEDERDYEHIIVAIAYS